MENTKTRTRFVIILSFFIILFSFAITPVTMQNDTFYTIRIGQDIANQGIDMKDHYSMHENLDYTYPHWLYDYVTYLIYDFGGFKAIYIATCIVCAILGLTIFYCNKKLYNNTIISFFITLITLFFLKPFITARAQLVTFILFALEYYIIEKLLKERKFRYYVELFIIATLIANIHIAVWPFFFILLLPHIGAKLWIMLTDKIVIDNSIVKAYERDIKNLEKQGNNEEKIAELKEKMEIEIIKRDKRKKSREEINNNSYKIIYDRDINITPIIIVFVISLFSGLLTPLSNGTVYTYLVKTLLGDSTHFISEHLPLTLIENPYLIAFLVFLGWLLFFNKTKIHLSDGFLVFGLTLLTVMSTRQESMLMLLGSFVVTKLVIDLFVNDSVPEVELIQKIDSKKRNYVYIFLFLLMICTTTISYNATQKFVDYTSYPTDAVEYINSNLDVDTIKLFNEYDYGSYLLFNNIPVFIDSRADLYTPEFNSDCEVLDDFMSISRMQVYPEEIFNKYGITHIILKNDSAIYTIVNNTDLYNTIYSDAYFTVFERI